MGVPQPAGGAVGGACGRAFLKNESENPQCTRRMRVCAIPAAGKSVQAFENSVELIDAVVMDHQFAAPAARVDDRDARRQLFGKLSLERCDVRIARYVLFGLSLRARIDAACGFFELTYGPAMFGGLQRQQRRAILRKRRQRARVAHVELAFVEQTLDLGRKIEKTQ